MAVDYGTDISCLTDLDPAMGLVSGLQLLAQALARRIISPRGSLIDDPNYGTDITAELNDDIGAGDLARIASSVDAEFGKDERVISSSTTATLAGGVLVLVSKMVGSNGPFKLVTSVSNVTAQVLSVGT